MACMYIHCTNWALNIWMSVCCCRIQTSSWQPPGGGSTAPGRRPPGPLTIGGRGGSAGGHIQTRGTYKDRGLKDSYRAWFSKKKKIVLMSRDVLKSSYPVYYIIIQNQCPKHIASLQQIVYWFKFRKKLSWPWAGLDSADIWRVFIV